MHKYSMKLYTKEVLLKTAFSFTDEMYIHLDAEEDMYIVQLTNKKGIEEEILYSRFENELIAQETRLIVSEKTKSIRELIVARALSSTIINKKVDEIEESDEYKSDNILKDWFEKYE